MRKPAPALSFGETCWHGSYERMIISAKQLSLPLRFPSWRIVKDGTPAAAKLANRHYSRLSRGRSGSRIMPPGKSIIILNEEQDWLFCWNRQCYRRDGLGRLPECTLFRNEGDRLSSSIILECEDVLTKVHPNWPKCVFTYVDPALVKSPNPGYCFRMAGWRQIDRSIKGLILMMKILTR